MKFRSTGSLAAALLLCAGALSAQDSGRLVTGAPDDVFLEVTTGDTGQPIVSEDEFTLVWGHYYRMNLVCPDAQNDDTGFHFEMAELLSNSHLRVVSVNDIEIYMQGLSFRAIECDEPGTARFSFHPMRKGVYPLLVRDHSDPPQAVTVRIVVE